MDVKHIKDYLESEFSVGFDEELSNTTNISGSLVVLNIRESGLLRVDVPLFSGVITKSNNNLSKRIAKVNGLNFIQDLGCFYSLTDLNTLCISEVINLNSMESKELIKDRICNIALRKEKFMSLLVDIKSGDKAPIKENINRQFNFA
ncbi:hypothetical protein M9194_20480 [Vibrio sp. S4M6]|uniref:hypothetical protein n=1 Tax=Vibrio sinus TaxID=2946865 RepID=UPI00202A17FA|nr:hypothetical protein [Vibrio sinus]MCL9783806.1 hypothetical protein [Vibrio sinus]